MHVLMFVCAWAHVYTWLLPKWKIQLLSPKGWTLISMCGRRRLSLALSLGGVIRTSTQMSSR